MLRRTFVATIAAAGVSLAARSIGLAQSDSGATPSPAGDEVTTPPPQTGYAPVNGLNMYYEIHGSGGVPLVLLHGGFGTIETDFGKVLPVFAQSRQVIGVEMQAHGHTADIDRPLRYEHLADDTAALLRHLGIDQVDVFGYSVGGGVALQLAIRHPQLVRKIVAMSAKFHNDGLYPEVLAFQAAMKPEFLAGTPWHDAYLRVAPNPDDFPRLLERITEMDLNFAGIATDAIQAITAPTQVIIGDADIIRPEHAVALFRLRGGGVPGDLAGLPSAQFAVLPGTTHIAMVERAEWLLSMSLPFLDAPMPETP